MRTKREMRARLKRTNMKEGTLNRKDMLKLFESVNRLLMTVILLHLNVKYLNRVSLYFIKHTF